MNRFLLQALKIILLLTSLTACQWTAGSAENQLATPSLNPPTALPAGTPTSSAPPVTVLRVWVTSELAQGAGGEWLKAQLEAFALSRPDIEIELRIKSRTGASGMIPSLQATQKAAPAITPDLLLLSSAQMWQASAKTLVQPVSPIVSTTQMTNFPPSAYPPARNGEQVYGIPFAANFLLSYTNSDTSSFNWEALVKSAAQYGFVASDVNTANTLVGYFASGGTIVQSEANTPTLERNALLRYFNWLQRLRDTGQLLPDLLHYHEMFELVEEWGNESNIWLLLDTRTLRRQANASKAISLGLPPQVGESTFLPGEYWYFALGTADQQRQNQIRLLVDTLLQADSIEAWATADGFVPLNSTSPSLPPALQALTSEFFTNGQVRLSPEITDPLAAALQKGLDAFLQGTASPANATDLILQSLSPTP